MKKSLLIVALLGILHPTLQAIEYTNKTYMAIPTPHYYLPMRYTSWHRILKQGSNKKDAWDSKVQAVPFFYASDNSIGLGKYFGTNYKNNVVVGHTSPIADIKTEFIIHNYNGTSEIEGCLGLHPKHTEYGVYLSFHQELENVNKGFFVEVNLPIESVENDLRVTIGDENKEDIEGVLSGICEYFFGKFNQTSDKNRQDYLRCAKLGCAHEQTGIADIEVIVGQDLVEKPEHTITGAIKVILPTGNKPCGEYLFPSVVGNGGHWELGAQINGSSNITKGAEYSLEALFSINYNFAFSSNEHRTLGYRVGFDSEIDDIETSAVYAWNYYLLGGEEGKMGVFPLANVLTQDVSVLPGGRLQGHASFAYHRNDTTIDFGYSFYAQEGEKISLKSCCWCNDRYAIPAKTYPTDLPFDVNSLYSAPPGWSNNGPIQRNMLSTNTPATPGFLKHAVHAAINYTSSGWDNPFAMGCGFSVEWAHDNANVVGYALWAKAGVTF